MLAIPIVTFIFENISERSESLHEALSGTFVEKGNFRTLVGDVFPEIEELLARVAHIGRMDADRLQTVLHDER